MLRHGPGPFLVNEVAVWTITEDPEPVLVPTYLASVLCAVFQLREFVPFSLTMRAPSSGG
jgi:hypothetical protein